MSLAVRLLLAPYLAGAWINSRIWTRNEPTQAAVDDGVAIGRMPSRGDSMAFASIVDLSAEMPALHAHHGWHAYPTLDLVAPPPSTLGTRLPPSSGPARAARFSSAARSAIRAAHRR